MSRIFNVQTSNKYMLKIDEIKNIEEAGDDFTTYEELCEMLGVNEDNPHQYFRQNTLREDLIKEELAAWKAKIPEGKKSIIIKDEDLIEVLVENAHLPASYFVPGLRRVGNRLFIHDATARTDASKKDCDLVIGCAQGVLNRMYKFEIKLTYTHRDRESALLFLGMHVKWKDIEEYVKGSQYYTEDKVVRMKDAWENPSKFTAEEKSD